MKIYLISVFALALSVGLVGCGGDKEDFENPPTNPAPTAPTAPTLVGKWKLSGAVGIRKNGEKIFFNFKATPPDLRDAVIQFTSEENGTIWHAWELPEYMDHVDHDPILEAFKKKAGKKLLVGTVFTHSSTESKVLAKNSAVFATLAGASVAIPSEEILSLPDFEQIKKNQIRHFIFEKNRKAELTSSKLIITLFGEAFSTVITFVRQ